MTDQLLNGFQLLGVTPIPFNIQSVTNVNRTNISTTVDAIYTTISRKINFNTVIHLVGIDMNYAYVIIVHWCVWFFVYHRFSELRS